MQRAHAPADDAGLPKFMTATPEGKASNIIIGAENTLSDAIDLLDILCVAAGELDATSLGTQGSVARQLLKRVQAELNAAQVLLGSRS